MTPTEHSSPHRFVRLYSLEEVAPSLQKVAFMKSLTLITAALLLVAIPVFATNVTNLAPHNYAPPAVAQFSLGVQHELKPSMIWVVQYVGNLAWHQWDDRYINNITPALGATSIVAGGKTAPIECLAGDQGNHVPFQFGNDSECNSGLGGFNGGTNAFREYQGYAGIEQQEMATNGSYNGFQTGLRLQNKWGLSGELDYTYSHEIDIQSYDNSCCVSDPWYIKYDKGSGALDRRQMVNANYVYKLPFFDKSQGLIHSIAGGWEVAGTFIDETGLVATVTGAGGVVNSGNGYDPVGLGGGYTVRPNIEGKMHYFKKMNHWFNVSQFSDVRPQWLGGPNLGFGNSAKDAVVGPGRVNFTTALYKSFAVTERAHFELRFESFNTFNHTEPNNLNVSYSPQNGNGFSSILNKGNTFGQVTTAWDPRNLELGGKFVF